MGVNPRYIVPSLSLRKMIVTAFVYIYFLFINSDES